ncbi:unnamed protein product, partial [marine sediment metagenome]
KKLRRQLAEPVGLVPTMGYFHEGHLSLVRRARAENPSVVVSIFVNPAQFGPQEDFSSYPRDPQSDLTMLEKEKADIVFMPSVAEMYPSGFSSRVGIARLTERLEGASRPSFFGGVTTVVTKLFNIIQPARVYFGQKDAQQAIVVRKMVADLNMTYHVTISDALHNAARFIQEGGAQAVKLEGGVTVAEKVSRIVECGIPVMGHIGLTPQSIHQLGGFKVQGKTPEAAARLLEDARALEEAGAFAIVLETVPAPLATLITQKVSIPTIG